MDTENKLRISEDFRNRLIELLQEDGGKKKDIAKKMKVDFRSLSNAYNFGIIPKPSTLMKMADYFNVSIDFLLGRSDNDAFFKSDNPVGFYARYSLLRDLRNLKDGQIATELHFDRTLCYKWKSKNHIPTLEILDLLCDYFNVSLDYLLGRTDD